MLGVFESKGIDVWIDGGWGVDALVGSQTRPHDDLDIVVNLSDVSKIQSFLAGLSFGVVEDELPTRFVMKDPTGLQIDFHTVTFDEEGGGVQVHQDGSIFRYSPQGFSAGTILGHPVRCISAEVQMLCHVGYEPDAKDFHDVRLLHKRFGLPLPAPYDSGNPKGAA
jgi:lincosamide nucleotidyltransferase A/C/D/E